MTPGELALFNQAVGQAQAGHKADAYNQLRNLYNTNPNDVSILLWIAFTSSDLRESETMINKAVVLEPGNAGVEAARRWLANQKEDAGIDSASFIPPTPPVPMQTNQPYFPAPQPYIAPPSNPFAMPMQSYAPPPTQPFIAPNTQQFGPPPPSMLQPYVQPTQMHQHNYYPGTVLPMGGVVTCPYCRVTNYPRSAQRISTAGWVVFAVMLTVCFPLFWIGLLMKEEQRNCSNCNMRLP